MVATMSSDKPKSRKWSLAWRQATPYYRAADPARWEGLRSRLEQMKDSLGLTYQDLEDATGIRRTHIQQFLVGRIEEPRFAFIVTLGAFFGLSPNDLAAALGLDVPDVKPLANHQDARFRALQNRLASLPPILQDRALDMCMSNVATLGALTQEQDQDR